MMASTAVCDASSPEFLRVANLAKHYDRDPAIVDVSFSLVPGEVLGIVGPNGAGKTTVFNLITGVYQPTDGGIAFNGQSLVGRKPHQITAGGIARTFQNIRLFPSFTVFDNVRTAFHLRLRSDLLWRLKANNAVAIRAAAEQQNGDQ